MPFWDPPAWPLALLGGVAIVAWLVLARGGGPGSILLRAAAAALLLLALVDAGWHGGAEAGRPRLVVLLDRSLSMDEPADGARARAARAWLASEDFARWTTGWDVEVDTFGGPTTDLGAAVDAAAATLPGALLLLSDGRAAGGRAPGATAVPLHARVTGPVLLDDAGVLDLAAVAGDGGARARVEVVAAGGRAVPAGRDVVVTVDGRAVGRVAVGALDAGERRVIEVPLPAGGEDPRLVEAALGPPADAVPGNDRRSVFWTPSAEPPRRLVVGLRPGWELAAWRRALAADGAPVDVRLSFAPGRLRSADGGAEAGWAALDPARYDVVALVGDPAALGAGAAWVERWLAAGGRGLLWSPEGREGALAGLGVRIGPGTRSGPPALTGAGATWLRARGAAPAATPDGGPPWPPLEALPAAPPAGVPGAALVTAGGQPAAWAWERGENRFALLLGTGWYRWALGDDPRAPTAAFWDAWSGALARWLAGATAVDRPLVHGPPGGRVARGAVVEATVAATRSPVRWTIEDAAGATVADGTLAPDSAPRALRAGPLAPGSYRIVAEAPGDGRRAAEPFVVETWAPDLAWTAADTAALAAAARASGGRIVDDAPPPLDRPSAAVTRPGAGHGPGLGSTPWALLAAALLVLADWALAGGALARRPGRP